MIPKTLGELLEFSIRELKDASASADAVGLWQTAGRRKLYAEKLDAIGVQLVEFVAANDAWEVTELAGPACSIATSASAHSRLCAASEALMEAMKEAELTPGSGADAVETTRL